MKSELFDVFLDFSQSAESTTLQGKAGTYATVDRMYNFNEATKLVRPTSIVTPETTAWGMAAKHGVVVLDIIYAHPDNIYSPHRDICYSKDQIVESFGDLINYLKLIQAMIIANRLPADWNLITTREEMPF